MADRQVRKDLQEVEHIQEECLWEDREEWGGLCHRVT
jgi:hypothetical protein